MKVTLDVSRVAIRLRKLPERHRRIVAQTLNRQWRQSRTLMTRGIAKALGVRPQKRIRRRILLPRAGRARPQKLSALGLSLVETMPARWFVRGTRGRGGGFTVPLPSGAHIINKKQTRGKPFKAQLRQGYTGVMRRVDPPRSRGTREAPTWLPIEEMMINTRRPAYRVREDVLDVLAKRYPREYTRRMKVEFRRVFG